MRNTVATRPRAIASGALGWISDDQHPDGEIRDQGARDLAEAAPAVDLEVGGEVLLPALAGWDLCGVHGRRYADSSGIGSRNLERPTG